MLGRFQFWLQGHGDPPPYRPRVVWELGNLLSNARFFAWKIAHREDPA